MLGKGTYKVLHEKNILTSSLGMYMRDQLIVNHASLRSGSVDLRDARPRCAYCPVRHCVTRASAASPSKYAPCKNTVDHPQLQLTTEVTQRIPKYVSLSASSPKNRTPERRAQTRVVLRGEADWPIAITFLVEPITELSSKEGCLWLGDGNVRIQCPCHVSWDST